MIEFRLVGCVCSVNFMYVRSVRASGCFPGSGEIFVHCDIPTRQMTFVAYLAIFGVNGYFHRFGEITRKEFFNFFSPAL